DDGPGRFKIAVRIADENNPAGFQFDQVPLLLKPSLHLGEQDSGFLSCHAKIIRGILPLKPPKRRSGLGFVKELRPFC
ncbi:hypothetical protein M1N47_04150, partial [Dehalococcoidia bacterium]|nr:hypothetical protein [Dehalococcoidia bacterium]